MVRPVTYQPKKDFKLGEAEVAAYKKVAENLNRKGDAKKAVEKIEAALAVCAQAPKEDDSIDKKELFANLYGDDKPDLDDVEIEEPRVVKDKEEVDNVNRDMW